MSNVAELLKEASKLDRSDRAELVSSLLEDLDASPHYVTDEEALRRVDDLRSGKVKGLSEEEFWTACLPQGVAMKLPCVDLSTLGDRLLR